MSLSAKFISFEGIDGCGKSTLLDQMGRWLDEVGIDHIRTREPGGTALGESIRSLLLDPSHKSMDPLAEVFLYTASRAQLAQEVIFPALHRGIWVLADRFSDATLAYQGYGRGLDLDRLRQIQEWACRGLRPHRTVLLDCSVDVALHRMRGRNGKADRIEGENESFHRRVRSGYLELARCDPQRFIVLNTEKPLHDVVEDLRSIFWLPFLETLHG